MPAYGTKGATKQKMCGREASVKPTAFVKWLLCGAVLLLGAGPAVRHSHYLFVWAMESRGPDPVTPFQHGSGKDFIAVFDVTSDAAPFAKLVAMLPVGNGAKMAHHTNYAMPSNDVLYANDWLADRTYVFDLHDAQHPRLIRQFGNAGPYMYPHSFDYLPNGDTLATFQYTRGYNRAPGGLVEFDA